MDAFEMMRFPAASVIVAFMALVACVGPRPVIVKRDITPPRSPGDPYIVLVTIRNTGRGEGQVQAVVRLRSRTTRQTAAESIRLIDLASFETVQVRFELNATAGAEYDVIVDAKYPP